MVKSKKDVKFTFEHVEPNDMLARRITQIDNSQKPKKKMEKIVGTAYSETTGITYRVRWETDGGDVWIKDPNNFKYRNKGFFQPDKRTN